MNSTTFESFLVKESVKRLSKKEKVLSQLLFENEGKVISREKLLKSVFGMKWNKENRLVDVYIGYLRKRIGRKFFVTERGKGYKFII